MYYRNKNKETQMHIACAKVRMELTQLYTFIFNKKDFKIV